MTESKMRRLVSASSVMAVIVFVILIAVMVGQLFVMGAKKAKIERLEAEIAQLEKQKSEIEDDIDLWLTEWKIEERARQLGMRK